MGIRRERPPVERSADSILVRLPDGTVKTIPSNTPKESVTADACCFCGHGVERSDAQRIRLSVRWMDEGTERTQSWSAHHTCLAERLHERVSGTGPFFGD
jgi:hypothetical protein